jgi:hypothetical protein
MDMPGSLDLDKKAARTSPNTFVKQSFTDDGRVQVGDCACFLLYIACSAKPVLAQMIAGVCRGVVSS